MTLLTQQNSQMANVDKAMSRSDELGDTKMESGCYTFA